MKAAIIFGSQSDRSVMKKAAEVLREFKVDFTAHILSAHRVPELLDETLRDLEAGGTVGGRFPDTVVPGTRNWPGCGRKSKR